MRRKNLIRPQHCLQCDDHDDPLHFSSISSSFASPPGPSGTCCLFIISNFRQLPSLPTYTSRAREEDPELSACNDTAAPLSPTWIVYPLDCIYCMGKLRDWWPSDDVLECNRPSSSSLASVRATSSSSAAAVALRLSEVTAALNSMPSQAVSANVDQASTPPSSSSPQQPVSRPIVKLTNSQDHKEELLRKLLSRSASSSDLQQQTATRPQSPSPQNHHYHHSSPIALKQNVPQFISRPSQSAHMPEYSSDRSGSKSKDACLHEVHDKPIQKANLSRREIHIFSERQRRKGMTHLYATLHSLLPEAKPKVKTDRCTVLTEAMDYIYVLRRQVEELNHHKAEVLASLGEQLNADGEFGFDGRGGTNVVGELAELSEETREQVLLAADVAVRVCGSDAFITLNSPRKKGVWSGILQILHDQEMELLNVTLSTSNDMDYHCIHAKIPASSEVCTNELQKLLQDLILRHAVLE